MGWIAGVTIAMSWLAGGEAPAAGSAKPLAPVPFTDVTISDAFWKPRVETARRRTLPHVFRMCEQTGRIANFDRAAGRLDGDHEGYFFNDSDVYKAVEAAAYALATERDPGLEQYVDDLIARIAAAQQPDGYLNTYFALTSGEQPWGNLRVRHELYCAGHLIEAAIAHHQATGKSTLLDVAVRFADLIGTIFGPGKRRDVPGHEEIELALIKLADLTSNAKYAKLAEFFLEQRGRPVGRELYGEYCQDHLPVSRQDRIVGHAVRAAYLYCAMADVARRTGSKSYLAALDRVWPDTVQAKMYITGGIGPSPRNGGLTEAGDLPNDTADAETGSATGMVLWAHRLHRPHAHVRPAPAPA
ncbi:MAG: glycoside hydrolase family 127 protein, partial [bacterium]|nr:glycoside hydrolase family 127 protein [bacterium]